jgi:hypothetical protein
VIEGFVWRFPARVQRVYDGDTIYLVDIDQGYQTHRAAASVSNKPERVRVLDLWCPEIRSSDPDEKARGLAAKAFAETLLPPRTIVIFSSHVWDRTLERTSDASSCSMAATTPRSWSRLATARRRGGRPSVNPMRFDIADHPPGARLTSRVSWLKRRYPDAAACREQRDEARPLCALLSHATDARPGSYPAGRKATASAVAVPG